MNTDESVARLTEPGRLTLIRQALQTVCCRDGGDLTLWDRLLDLGFPIDLLFEDVLPLSCPPFTRAEYEQLLNWLSEASRRASADYLSMKIIRRDHGETQ